MIKIIAKDLVQNMIRSYPELNLKLCSPAVFVDFIIVELKNAYFQYSSWTCTDNAVRRFKYTLPVVNMAK